MLPPESEQVAFAWQMEKREGNVRSVCVRLFNDVLFSIGLISRYT